MVRIVRTNDADASNSGWVAAGPGPIQYRFHWNPSIDPPIVMITKNLATPTDKGLAVVALEYLVINDLPPRMGTSREEYETVVLREIENYCWFKLHLAIEA